MYVVRHTHSKPEVNADRKAPCRIHILDALPNKPSMYRFICCHLPNGRILSVNDDSRDCIERKCCQYLKKGFTYAVNVYVKAVPAGPASNITISIKPWNAVVNLGIIQCQNLAYHKVKPDQFPPTAQFLFQPRKSSSSPCAV